MDERTVRVAVQEGGERIDKYLAAYGEPFVSRNFVQSLIADGRVRVNGSVVNRPSFRLSAGDVIEVVLPLPPSPVPEPEAIPLDIVYEDGSVIVVNKPRGMVVHPAPGNTEGTLVNALLAHCELRGVGSKERPGIVHRLDKGTSGLMVVAKSERAYTVLKQAFRDRKIPTQRFRLISGHPLDVLNNLRDAAYDLVLINADKLGASSTSNADRRITPVGHFIRRFKIDELTQLWNVLIGDMSLVGPRPQVQSGVDLYTAKERELLLVKPGITDFASVVFSDEGTILSTSVDPDADYDRLIRPWKSRLGLVYIASRSLWLDIQLVVLTVVAIFSRAHALEGVAALLTRLNVDRDLVEVARRRDVLRPANPPGDEYMPLVPR